MVETTDVVEGAKDSVQNVVVNGAQNEVANDSTNDVDTSNDMVNTRKGRTYFTPPAPGSSYNDNSNTQTGQYNAQPVQGNVINSNTQGTYTVQGNEDTSNDGLSTASLICGILSFFFNIFAIPGLITGYLYKNKPNTSTQGRKQAKAGIICSWISVGIYVAILIFYLVCVGMLGAAVAFTN